MAVRLLESGSIADADAVRRALERVLASPGFEASARNRHFLEYIVEETLAGRADRLKGLSIAIDVFGRAAATFDPQQDPVVRVEAGKLRRRLERYYLTAGRDDPIRIDIPKGGYVPTFERRGAPGEGAPAPAGESAATAPQPAAQRAARPRSWWLTTALLAALALGALGWFGADLLASRLRSDGPEDAATALPRGPKIAVLPFANLSGDPEQAYFAEGVTDQIVTDLARFNALFVLSMESTAKYQEQAVDPQRLNREFGVDYLLDGSIRHAGDTIRLSTRLVDAASGKIIWSQTYRDQLTPASVFDIQEDVSQQVSVIVASNYGMIAEADLAGARHRPSSSLEAYDCVLRYYHYQRSFNRQEHVRVRDCLERAVEIDPRNATGQLTLANALFDRHDLVGFEAAGERAISLNPNDPEVLAHFGMRLTYVGEWERGVALVTKAIALNPDHPEWYIDPIIYYHYQTGDYEQALTEVRRPEVARPWRLLFEAMILGQLGRREEAQPVIEAVLKLKPDVRERLWNMARIWNAPDADIEQMADGLRKAGLAIAPAPPSS